MGTTGRAYTRAQFPDDVTEGRQSYGDPLGAAQGRGGRVQRGPLATHHLPQGGLDASDCGFTGSAALDSDMDHR